MTHRDMNHLSLDELNFEAGQSKQCLADHGINATIFFAIPHGDASDNTTVINVIAKYYDFADTGFSDLLFLQCESNRFIDNKNKMNLEVQTRQLNQQKNGCNTFSNDGSLSFTNRYSLKEWSHNSADASYRYKDIKIFDNFVRIVNSQARFNKNGIINTIPIVAYHMIDDSGTPNSNDINLFAKEMKYLHDNGFRVIPMYGLVYDNNNNSIHLVDVLSIT